MKKDFGFKIIEEKSEEDIVTKILMIELPTLNHLDILFTPKLENLSFIKFSNKLTVNLKNSTFREFFNNWVNSFSVLAKDIDTIDRFIDLFNAEILAIITLGRKEKKISWESARGLYGELLYIKSLILKNNYTKLEIINAWHRPEPAIHDFEFKDFTLEVKTISRDNTTVKISSILQLQEIEGKPLLLNIYRIEKINDSDIDSLGILYNEIINLLDKVSSNLFIIKCAEDVFCEYLGPKENPLDYKFNLIECNIYNVNQIIFPRIKKDDILSSISKVTYCIDISALDPFKL